MGGGTVRRTGAGQKRTRRSPSSDLSKTYPDRSSGDKKRARHAPVDTAVAPPFDAVVVKAEVRVSSMVDPAGAALASGAEAEAADGRATPPAGVGLCWGLDASVDTEVRIPFPLDGQRGSWRCVKIKRSAGIRCHAQLRSVFLFVPHCVCCLACRVHIGMKFIELQ